MTSKSTSGPWDFSEALQLINTLSSPSPSAEKRQPQYYDTHRDGIASNHEDNGKPSGVGLGNFSRLWEYLGQPEDATPPHILTLTTITPPDKPSYISDGATYRPPSAKGVKWKDEAEDGASLTDTGKDATAKEQEEPKQLTKTQRKKARRRARAELAARQRTASDFESEADVPHAPARKASVHSIPVQERLPAHVHNLRPRSDVGTVVTPTKSKASAHQQLTSSVITTPTPKASSGLPSQEPKSAPSKSAATPQQYTSFATPSQPSKVQASQQLQAALQAGYQHQLPAHISHTTAPVHTIGNQQPLWLQPGFLHPPAAATAAAIGGKQSRTRPLVIREGDDRNLALRLKLIHDFGEDKKWLTSPVPTANHTRTPNGIHVFIDYSNIWIGFMELVKRLTGLHPNARTPHQNLSFDSLVLLLERGRPVAKRVLAGSAPYLPAFETAKAIGYELNILDKVFKAKELTERQRRFASKGSGGAATTSEGSGSEMGNAASGVVHAREKWVEQGVDEILHLKLLESIVDAADAEVSTIVLATGDAAEAEYSAGFMRMVERALKKGWKVELVSWSKGMSYLYRKRDFLTQWEGKFRVVDLDEFADYLLDT